MPDRPSDLPDYSNPPIDEVVLGIQFSAMSGSVGPLVAAYREGGVKEEYPGIQYQPRLPPTPMPEQLGLAVGLPLVPVAFQLSVGPPQATLDRIWLIGNDDSLLIQIQNDRFIHNWRRRAAGYPHFEALHAAFWQRFGEFREVAKNLSMPVEPQLLEVSYINWISDIDMNQQFFFAPAKAGAVELRYAKSTYEPVLWSAVYNVNRDERALGRINVNCQSGAVRAVGTSVQRGTALTLQFVASLEPGTSDEAVTGVMALARNVIVQGFTNLTTPEAHEKWGRIK